MTLSTPTTPSSGSQEDSPNVQQVLQRVLAYLSSLGITETRSVATQALQLVKESFASESTDLYADVMERLPAHFQQPPVSLPPSLLPVERGSIGYTAPEPLETAPLSIASWQKTAWIRRGILTALVFLQTFFATRFALVVLPYHGGNALEIAIAVVFAILFTWISIGFWMAVYGFILRRCGGDAQSLCRRHPDEKLQQIPLARTAILLPIYHEPIERTLGGLRAVYRSLQDSGQLEHFDFFILSDSRSPDVWLAEQATWYQLVQELQAEGKLFYRRRSLNMHYKSGNVADFLRRWGRKYTYSVVLDADSLMAGDTLVKMVRLMECEPRVGILQTAPTLVNAKSLFARCQQFGNQVYGPLFSTGLAALQLGEAVYWGHNAIFRNQLFMSHCGLRQLDGIGLFKGPILSHDFVEAAYMGRAGYEVWLEPALSQSYEESPPTLEDDLTRDRRWAKGNLQHLWLLLFEKRLRFAHRMAFLNGVMSYCASPLWFLFLMLSTLEVSRILLQPINYFPQAHSLFPVWPEWHPQFAIALASSTLCLLFLPKVLAVLDVMLLRQTQRWGGALSLWRSVLLEMWISILLAPVRMLAHSRYVLEALLNLQLSWAGQNRTHETNWVAAFTAQFPAMLLALSWGGFAWWLDPLFFLWSLPVALPVILSVPVAVILGRVSWGQRFRRWGFLQTPEEVQDSPLIQELDRMTLSSANRLDSAFIRAVLDPVLNRVHGELARPRTTGAKQQALRRLREKCLSRSPEQLDKKELSLLAQDQESLRWLHERAWRQEESNYWTEQLSIVFSRPPLAR